MRWTFWLVVMVLVVAGPAEARAPLTTKTAVTRAKRWARGREGSPSFAVVTERGTLRGLHPARTYPSASVVKAMVMVAVLRAARHRALTAAERAQLKPMIELSDNRAADALFAFHGPAALQAVARAARMRHFAVTTALFEARIAAGDQARFFARIDRLVPRRHRAFARYLLSHVVSYERWGIPPAALRHHLTPYFKGGWRTRIVHQVALLQRGRRRIAIAVLSNGPTMAYGEATIEGIAERVLSPPSRPAATFSRPRRPAGRAVG